MPDSPNRLSQFWQELKRRKVLRVITVYAAVAFVILQLIEILAPSLRLPEWTMNFILVVLIVGFVIAVILSWIYDIHPEGGIVKTEPAHKVKPEDIPKSSKSWKIASYISFVVIVGLIVLNVIPRNGKEALSEILDKSIAVLPFRNDSPDQENEYFINGYMESILNNLCKIEDLRVISRSSVEQYRDSTVSIPDVAEEQIVSYVLEGSMQKYGDHIRLTLQLIDRNDNHVWGEQYDREITRVEEHLSLQSEIAQQVAAEIKAVITPAERELIEKISTINQTAYDFYQRGKEEHWRYRTDIYNLTALDRSEDQYNKALSYDSTFGQAYLGLAEIYMDRNIATEFLSENYLDTTLVLVNKALSYDSTLSEAYVLRGRYYGENGYNELALNEYNKALEINPNSWEAYSRKAGLYDNEDKTAVIDNLHKAISLNRGRELPDLLRTIGYQFQEVGFFEIARNYYQEKLSLDHDSFAFIYVLASIEESKDNIEGAEKYARELYEMDSSNLGLLYAYAEGYIYLGQYKESLEMYEKWLDQLGNTLVRQQRYNGMHRVAYAYWINERYEEAEHYFDRQMEICNRCIELDNSYAQSGGAYYDRAGIYAFRGEREKALEDLRIFSQRKIIPGWWNWLIKHDPLFDSIRDEPEFQQIGRDVETKYQAEHERVRQWLEENHILFFKQ